MGRRCKRADVCLLRLQTAEQTPLKTSDLLPPSPFQNMVAPLVEAPLTDFVFTANDKETDNVDGGSNSAASGPYVNLVGPAPSLVEQQTEPSLKSPTVAPSDDSVRTEEPPPDLFAGMSLEC